MNEGRVCAGSNLANILSTNLFATAIAPSTFDTDYQQKDFQRQRIQINENHIQERAP